MSGWIGVDLDGTLAQYGGWIGIDHVGDPVPAMLARVKDWISQGREVRIFTARVCRDNEREEVTAHIHAWCERHGLPPLAVTCQKDFGMITLYDDRCIQVEMNTGRLIGA